MLSYGIILFGNILKYLFYAFPIPIKFIFIGLILGSIPALIKKAIPSRNSFKIHYILYLLISIFVGIGLVFLEKNLTMSASTTEYNILFLILSGFLMSAGVIIPGVSSTLILMLLGVYDAYLLSVSTLYLPLLFPLGIGLLLGCFVFMKLTKFLLDNYYPQTFFTIIGFTLGSVFILYPGFTFDLNGIISILSLALGLCISNLI